MGDDIFQPVEPFAAGALLDRVDDHVRRRGAVLHHDLAGRGQARVLIGLQRRNRIGLALEQPRQGCGVEDRLRAAVAALRIHRMGGVAQQRHALEAPARQRIAVDHRIGQDLVGAADQRRHIHPVEYPILIGREKVLQPAGLVPVDRHRHRTLDLADPVDELIAVLIGVAAQRIDQHRRMPRADAGDAGAGQERLPPRRATPQVEAAKTERPLVGIVLRAHRGVDAVAGDQHVAFRRRQRPALRIGEVRGDAAAALLDAHAAMPGDEVVRPDPLAHGGQQHPLQVGAKQRDMRPQMAGRLAERLAIDELAVAGEEGVVLRLAGGGDQRVLEPERAQLLHRVRADVDADAERPHLGRGLEHPDAARRARGVQRQGQHRAADPAADDDRVHDGFRMRAL